MPVLASTNASAASLPLSLRLSLILSLSLSALPTLLVEKSSFQRFSGP